MKRFILLFVFLFTSLSIAQMNMAEVAARIARLERNPTISTSVTLSSLTASTILSADASKKVVSLATATYPSLTELTYVKGVTSAIQTQMNLKAALISPAFTTPNLGTPSAGTLTSCTGLPLTTGISFPTLGTVIWSPAGAIQSDSVGTNTTPVQGSRYWTEITIPYNATITGISYLVGSVGGTDSLYAELYNSVGTLVKTSTKAIVGTAQQIQSCAFGTTYAAVAGKYYVALQFNGTTARFMTHSVTGSKFVTGSAVGTFGVAATLTAGTTYTVDVGPFVATY